MSDPVKDALPNGFKSVSADSSELSSVPAPRPRAQSSAGVPLTKTASGTHRAISAARPAVTAAAQTAAVVGEKLKSEAENVGLNALAVVKESLVDFQKSSRFFKYKAMIVAAWVALSVAGVVIAWPTGSTDSLGATLYQPESSSNVFMIKNEGEKTWTNVLIVVNGKYRLAAPNISPLKDVTFNPKQLTGPDGEVPSAELFVTDLEVRTDEGKSKLLENGVAKQ
jgi:hypothetical protein